jgi:ribosomal protein L37AE/L43A
MEDTVATTLICPFCAEAALHSFGRNSARCEHCGGVLGGELLVTLHQIAVLPAGAGRHACECGHPEMRLLPDGVYRCPACGSEVTPVSAGPTTWKPPDHTEAYWCGWLDSRYGKPACFTDNWRLAKWDDPSDRLDYYRGHRAGREARLRRTRLIEAS